MKLLTQKILADFKKQGRTNNKPSDEVKIIAKFFNPIGTGTWYSIEYDEEKKIFFGFVSLFNDYNDEFSYFSLKDLEDYKGALGLKIERDLHFGNHYLNEILNGGRP